jgi:spermidine synthase
MSKRSSAIRKEEPRPIADPAETPAAEPDYRDLAPWLLLFAGSGCAALIYEIVWFQLLQLVIGSSAVSLGLLLAAYMGGLCVGSMALPKLISREHNAMRVYAMLEAGIAVFGIIALVGVPLIGRIYVAGASSGLPGLVLRGMVAAVCLLPPTLLMGASLPAIARSVETSPGGVSWLGFLYSANVAGAVVGCLLAGFYLLRVHDMAFTTYTAAAINIAVAALAWALAGRRRNTARKQIATEGGIRRAPDANFIYAAIAFSGLTALGAEVIWTRLLSLLLGATVYTFSIILAVFLTGLWAGSSAGSFLSRRVKDSRMALAGCQILLAIAIAWTAFTLTYVLPYWPVDPWLSINPWLSFDLDLARSIRAILPATLLWGASFPLALAAAAGEGEDPARLTGEVYAANTAGSIVGALVFSLVLIPWIGTQGSQQVLIWLAAAAGVVAFLPAVLKNPSPRWRAAAIAAAIAVVAWGLTATVAPVPWQAIAYGRRVAPILRNASLNEEAQAKPLFVGEGINSSVVITQLGEQKSFYVSGKSEASSVLLDMRLQRMMGHLPALFHPSPRAVLVVGFGAGVTAGSFVPYPEVAGITISELEPIIPPASDAYFGEENDHVLHDARTRVIYDDARHYILVTPEKFDVITTDPIHPWVKGTSSLYSREYFELVKSHLNPGGIAAQWLPVYESDEETVRTELATFFSVFPEATVWSNYLNGDGYDLVLLGSADPLRIDVDRLEQRLEQSGYSGVDKSLVGAGFHSAVELLATYAGRGPDLTPMTLGAQINDDMNMRLQYIAGMGVNSVSSPRIYKELLSYRRFPEDLFPGSGQRIETLRELIGRRRRTF